MWILFFVYIKKKREDIWVNYKYSQVDQDF